MKTTSAMLSMLPLLFLSGVSAHGFVSKVKIGGTTFKGSSPNSGSTKGVVRVISKTDPVKGADNANINCGQDATAVDSLAKGQPGDTMEFTWDAGDGENWPHNTGPLMTYMAECTNGDCTTFDATDAAWFKIDEQGFDESTGAWVQQTIMNGEPAKVTLPSTLAAGDYMVRHEIIALHLASADSTGGAEFYPSCTQLTVGGSETGAAKKSEKVAFPGGYSDTDAGIEVNAFSTKGTVDYVFPGPDIAAFVDGSSSSSGGSSASGSDSSPSSTASSSSAAPTTNSAATSGSCKLKKMKKRTAQVNWKRSPQASGKRFAPTHYSRVFRGVDLSV